MTSYWRIAMLRPHIKRGLLGSIAAAGGASLIALGAIAPAYADVQSPNPLGTIGAGESTTRSFIDESCLSGGGEADQCSYTTGVSLGTPTTVTKADVVADEGLTDTQKAEILASAADKGRFAISSNRWSQFTTGVAYTQTQNGVFYYDGSRVWVTQNISGRQGSHTCFTNYVITGWGISNINKSDTGSSAARTLYCGWNVNQPAWVTTSWSMTATVRPNGTISGAGATIG